MANSNGTRARRKSRLTKAELKRLNRQKKIITYMESDLEYAERIAKIK